MIDKINNILAEKCSLHGFYFIDEKYGWFKESRMLNLNLYLKDKAHLIEKDSARLTLLILAAINGNITSPARGYSIITSYENAVLFSFNSFMTQVHFI